MTTFEEIIAGSRLSTRVLEYPSLEVVVKTEVPHATMPHTMKSVNEILKAMEFPYIKEYMLEDSLALLDLLNNLSIEYAAYGLEISRELQALWERQQRITAYAEREKSCDVMEVRLANLREEYSRMEEYSGYDLDEVRRKLGGVKSTYSNMKTEDEHRGLLDEIVSSLSGGSISASVLEHLSYLRDTRECRNALEKDGLVKEIGRMSECQEKIVYVRLCSGEVILLSDLERETGCDRITLLKIVYDLLSRNIIAFDRSRDVIYLLR
jgi:hypothetical protein